MPTYCEYTASFPLDVFMLQCITLLSDTSLITPEKHSRIRKKALTGSDKARRFADVIQFGHFGK